MYRPQDFFGQLHNIVVINVLAAQELQLTEPSTLVLTVIQNLKVEDSGGTHHYKDSPTSIGRLEVVDLAPIQCSVGQLLDRGSWVIIDHSGPFAQASFELD